MGNGESVVTRRAESEMPHPRLVTGCNALRAELKALRRGGGTVGCVPTMGALHEGHLSLVDASRAETDVTVVTIFVNPNQFGPDDDLQRYPKSLDTDIEAIRHRGGQVIFAPSAEEIYRPDHQTYVEVGPVAEPLEGEFRPGHFRGVATVVLKLFHLIAPDIAFFGRKDYQQALVVRQMVADFDLPVQIRTGPTVRESDGLARSSRNQYLSAEQRRRALAIPAGLELAAKLVASGERDAECVRQQVIEHLRAVGKVEPQYVALVRDGTVTPVSKVDGPTVLAIAAVFGETRLIDNSLIG